MLTILLAGFATGLLITAGICGVAFAVYCAIDLVREMRKN